MKQSMNENRPVGTVDQGNRAELKRRKDRRWIALLMFSVMGIVAIFSLLGVILLEEEKVVLQGRIEATEIRISGKLPGRVVDFCVKEGEAVRAGDTLVWISSPEAEAKYRQAYAMEEVARYQNEKVDEGTRKQIIQSAMQLWNKSRVDLELARSTYRRVQALYLDSVVTPQREEEVKAAYLSAQAGEKAAHQQYLLALEGAQKQDKESAQAMVSAAKASVAQVDALLEDAFLTAPEAGEISCIFLQRGELVGAGMPIMNLVVLTDCYVVLNVREDYMPYFRMGELFRGRVPALGEEEITFRIDYISPLGSFATWRSTQQSGGYDMCTFEIHGRPVEPVSGLRPGMSVLVSFRKEAE
jgi:HlyD family secretion protein